MARYETSALAFRNELMTMIKTIVWKNTYESQKYENGDYSSEVDEYLTAASTLLENYSTSQILNYLSYNDTEWNVFISKVEKRFIRSFNIVRTYEEHNDYYRKLAGLPPESIVRYDSKAEEPYSGYAIPLENMNIKSLQYAIFTNYTINNTTPVYLHQLTKAQCTFLESAGYFGVDGINAELLIRQDKNYEYLNHLTARRIAPFVARLADRFELLYTPSSELPALTDNFIAQYDASRQFLIQRYYSEAYRNRYEFYEGFIGMAILFMTIQQLNVLYLDTDITREFFDMDSIRMVYDAYSVPFYPTIPPEYHLKIVKAINRLLSYKGSNYVFFDLTALFDFDKLNIYQYYLLKRQRLNEDGTAHKEYIPVYGRDDTIVDYELDYEHTYDFKFVKRALRGESPYAAIQNESNYLNYKEVVDGDNYWWDDADLREKMYQNEYNFIETKYIGMQLQVSVQEFFYDNIFFMRMLMDNRDYMQNIPVVSYALSKYGVEADLFSFVIYIHALIVKKLGWTGTFMDHPGEYCVYDRIPTEPTKVAKLMGFNFKDDLQAIYNDLIITGQRNAARVLKYVEKEDGTLDEVGWYIYPKANHDTTMSTYRNSRSSWNSMDVEVYTLLNGNIVKYVGTLKNYPCHGTAGGIGANTSYDYTVEYTGETNAVGTKLTKTVIKGYLSTDNIKDVVKRCFIEVIMSEDNYPTYTDSQKEEIANEWLRTYSINVKDESVDLFKADDGTDLATLLDIFKDIDLSSATSVNNVISNSYVAISKMKEFIERKMLECKDHSVYMAYKHFYKLLTTVDIIPHVIEKSTPNYDLTKPIYKLNYNDPIFATDENGVYLLDESGKRIIEGYNPVYGSDGLPIVLSYEIKEGPSLATSFEDLLEDINYSLNIRLMSLEDEDEIANEIDSLLIVLSNICTELKYIRTYGLHNIEVIVEYLYKMLIFFKSVKVQLLDFKIIYLIDSEVDNMIKFLGQIDSTIREYRYDEELNEFFVVIDYIYENKLIDENLVPKDLLILYLAVVTLKTTVLHDKLHSRKAIAIVNNFIDIFDRYKKLESISLLLDELKAFVKDEIVWRTNTINLKLYMGTNPDVTYSDKIGKILNTIIAKMTIQYFSNIGGVEYMVHLHTLFKYVTKIAHASSFVTPDPSLKYVKDYFIYDERLTEEYFTQPWEDPKTPGVHVYVYPSLAITVVVGAGINHKLPGPRSHFYEFDPNSEDIYTTVDVRIYNLSEPAQWNIHGTGIGGTESAHDSRNVITDMYIDENGIFRWTIWSPRDWAPYYYEFEQTITLGNAAKRAIANGELHKEWFKSSKTDDEDTPTEIDISDPKFVLYRDWLERESALEPIIVVTPLEGVGRYWDLVRRGIYVDKDQDLRDHPEYSLMEEVTDDFVSGAIGIWSTPQPVAIRFHHEINLGGTWSKLNLIPRINSRNGWRDIRTNLPLIDKLILDSGTARVVYAVASKGLTPDGEPTDYQYLQIDKDSNTAAESVQELTLDEEIAMLIGGEVVIDLTDPEKRNYVIDQIEANFEEPQVTYEYTIVADLVEDTWYTVSIKTPYTDDLAMHIYDEDVNDVTIRNIVDNRADDIEEEFVTVNHPWHVGFEDEEQWHIFSFFTKHNQKNAGIQIQRLLGATNKLAITEAHIEEGYESTKFTKYLTTENAPRQSQPNYVVSVPPIPISTYNIMQINVEGMRNFNTEYMSLLTRDARNLSSLKFNYLDKTSGAVTAYTDYMRTGSDWMSQTNYSAAISIDGETVSMYFGERNPGDFCNGFAMNMQAYNFFWDVRYNGEWFYTSDDKELHHIRWVRILDVTEAYKSHSITDTNYLYEDVSELYKWENTDFEPGDCFPPSGVSECAFRVTDITKDWDNMNNDYVLGRSYGGNNLVHVDFSVSQYNLPTAVLNDGVDSIQNEAVLEFISPTLTRRFNGYSVNFVTRVGSLTWSRSGRYDVRDDGYSYDSNGLAWAAVSDASNIIDNDGFRAQLMQFDDTSISCSEYAEAYPLAIMLEEGTAPSEAAEEYARILTYPARNNGRVFEVVTDDEYIETKEFTGYGSITGSSLIRQHYIRSRDQWEDPRTRGIHEYTYDRLKIFVVNSITGRMDAPVFTYYYSQYDPSNLGSDQSCLHVIVYDMDEGRMLGEMFHGASSNWSKVTSMYFDKIGIYQTLRYVIELQDGSTQEFESHHNYNPNFWFGAVDAYNDPTCIHPNWFLEEYPETPEIPPLKLTVRADVFENQSMTVKILSWDKDGRVLKPIELETLTPDSNASTESGYYEFEMKFTADLVDYYPNGVVPYLSRIYLFVNEWDPKISQIYWVKLQPYVYVEPEEEPEEDPYDTEDPFVGHWTLTDGYLDIWRSTQDERWDWEHQEEILTGTDPETGESCTYVYSGTSSLGDGYVTGSDGKAYWTYTIFMHFVPTENRDHVTIKLGRSLPVYDIITKTCTVTDTLRTVKYDTECDIVYAWKIDFTEVVTDYGAMSFSLYNNIDAGTHFLGSEMTYDWFECLTWRNAEEEGSAQLNVDNEWWLVENFAQAQADKD